MSFGRRGSAPDRRSGNIVTPDRLQARRRALAGQTLGGELGKLFADIRSDLNKNFPADEIADLSQADLASRVGEMCRTSLGKKYTGLNLLEQRKLTGAAVDTVLAQAAEALSAADDAENTALKACCPCCRSCATSPRLAVESNRYFRI